MLENFLQDFRFAVRTLGKNPAVTSIAALSLALGIGANTAIFSLIDTVLLKSLPVRDPQELALISDPNAQGVSAGTTSGTRELFSYEEFTQIRDRQQVFQAMYAAESSPSQMSGSVDGGAPEQIRTQLVTGAYFSVLGVQAAAGRTFTAEEDRTPHGAPFAVISYAYWDKRFGRSAEALGKKLQLARASLTIIGVAAPGFFGETVGQAPAGTSARATRKIEAGGESWDTLDK